jgi:hypothetical protein
MLLKGLLGTAWYNRKAISRFGQPSQLQHYIEVSVEMKFRQAYRGHAVCLTLRRRAQLAIAHRDREREASRDLVRRQVNLTAHDDALSRSASLSRC